MMERCRKNRAVGAFRGKAETEKQGISCEEIQRERKRAAGQVKRKIT